MMNTTVKKIQKFVLKSNFNLPPTCNLIEIKKLEIEIGFNISPLLVDLLVMVANGGFGPGYGIIGIGPNGAKSDLGDLSVSRTILKDALVDSLPWPCKLLPFCEWGSNIYSCVDCETDSIWLYRNNRIIHQPFYLTDFLVDWMKEDTAKYVDWGTTPKKKKVRNPVTGEEEFVVIRVLE